jgi:hypothetical protein
MRQARVHEAAKGELHLAQKLRSSSHSGSPIGGQHRDGERAAARLYLRPALSDPHDHEGAAGLRTMWVVSGDGIEVGREDESGPLVVAGDIGAAGFPARTVEALESDRYALRQTDRLSLVVEARSQTRWRNSQRLVPILASGRKAREQSS